MVLQSLYSKYLHLFRTDHVKYQLPFVSKIKFFNSTNCEVYIARRIIIIQENIMNLVLEFERSGIFDKASPIIN